jgi:hypothetical protein
MSTQDMVLRFLFLGILCVQCQGLSPCLLARALTVCLRNQCPARVTLSFVSLYQSASCACDATSCSVDRTQGVGMEMPAETLRKVII